MRASPSIGRAAAAPAVGQVLFTATNFSWTVPEGVTEISVVCIGAGQRPPDTLNTGKGGSLRYVNKISVTPGEVLSGNIALTSAGSRLRRGSDVLCGASWGGASASQVGAGSNGGNGRAKATGQSAAGGGAGGFLLAGGAAPSGDNSRGGGGVDPYGRVLTQALGGTAPGGIGFDAHGGGNYGGGGGLYYNPESGSTLRGGGGDGCVRVIWGEGRAFPNTLTEDM